MHIYTLHKWQHLHNFSSVDAKGERRTRYVLGLTALTMLVEILAGNLSGSMALLADGWHMGTHVAAFLITMFAYRYARRYAQDARFAFGTGKIGVLGGFASAVALAVVAVIMGMEAITRLLSPQPIHFNEAIAVALLGLLVNVISAYLLEDAHEHDHHDHNLHAAYLHVVADALTSLFAIIALFTGKYLGWAWLDPLMAIVGAFVITHWAYDLLKDTSLILLDGSIDAPIKAQIISEIERHADNRISDIHVWKVGPEHYAAIISIVTHHPEAPEVYKLLLRDFQELSHVTIEINPCHDAPCL